MKILVKFPTRERPGRFYETLKGYIEKAIDLDNIQFQVTYDDNDPRKAQYQQIIDLDLINVNFTIGHSTGKINACNRDMENFTDWDICVLASDDMICQQVGWDELIREAMKQHFPDTDGVLYFYDGHQALNTMCILGYRYFKRFNYIYHPDYISLWADNEFMEVADKLNKQARFEDILFEHQCWFNGKEFAHTKDDLQVREQKYFDVDKQTFERRKLINFGL